MPLIDLLERHSSAVMAAAMSVMAAAGTATVALLFQMNAAITGLQVGQEHTGRNVQEIKAALSTTYSVERAKEAHEQIWATDRDQYKRLESLEGELREVKTHADQISVRIDRLTRGH